jgi:ring-1,2-phenylacetyl-CoA epoxidase subunit PaaB
VVKADNIFMMTREELEANPDFWLKVSKADGTPTTFHIFTKTNQRRSMTFVQHAGQIEAASTKAALHQAIQSDEFDTNGVWVWWVVPEDQIIRSDDDEIDTLFAPAIDKTYRQQTHYGFVSPRRQKRGRQDK